MKLNQINSFKERLAGELPGYLAHHKVMNHRKGLHQLEGLPEGARESAVLFHLYPKNGELYTVFILRATYSGVHSAQVGLPGGKREPLDVNLQETALREASEELNIKKEELEVLGQLSPLYVPPSNFIIYPYVSFQNSMPQFIPQEREVDEVLQCKLSTLIDQGLQDSVVIVRSDRMKVKGYHVNDRLIWGATAMIIKEFTEVVATL